MFSHPEGRYGSQIVERAEALKSLLESTASEYKHTVENSIDGLARGTYTAIGDGIRSPRFERYTLEDCTRDAAQDMLDALRVCLPVLQQAFDEHGTVNKFNAQNEALTLARAAILKATTAPELEVEA